MKTKIILIWILFLASMVASEIYEFIPAILPGSILLVSRIFITTQTKLKRPLLISFITANIFVFVAFLIALSFHSNILMNIFTVLGVICGFWFLGTIAYSDFLSLRQSQQST